MTDIIERLMRFAGKVCLSTDTEIEAAAEIERLRAELATAWKEAEEQNEAVCEVLRKIGDMRTENEKLRAALKRWEDTGLQKDWPVTYDGFANRLKDVDG